jgi:lysophospholipase L1-like esterase
LAAVALLAGFAFACGGPSKPSPVDQFPNGPKITCPEAPAPVTSPTGQATVVQYGTPTVSGGAPAVSVSCSPPAGSPFPIGTTAVTCTATDTRQRVDSCAFNVVVNQSPRLSATRFIAFGDSITWGEDGRTSLVAPEGAAASITPRFRFPTPQTYPGALLALLQARYLAQLGNLGVANAGMPGEFAADSTTRARFSGIVSSRLYEVVLLMEGSNDIGDRDARLIPPAIDSLRQMIRDAKSRGVKVFLATIPPIVAGRPRGLAWSLVPEMNSNLRGLAGSEGVPLVDVEAAFGPSFDQYLGFDGLHPNEAGYAKIAEAFFDAIKSNLETAQPQQTPAAFNFVHGLHR